MSEIESLKNQLINDDEISAGLDFVVQEEIQRNVVRSAKPSNACPKDCSGYIFQVVVKAYADNGMKLPQAAIRRTPAEILREATWMPLVWFSQRSLA